MARNPGAAPAKKKAAIAARKARKEKRAAVPEVVEHPVRTLRDEVNRLFESFEKGLDVLPFRRRLFDVEPYFEPFRNVEQIVFGKQPSADLVETDDEFRVSAELPGMSEDDVEVTFSEGLLTVKGEKEEKKEEEKENVHVSERRYGTFSRSFRLPPSVDADKVDATMKDGVLTVVLPKKPEAKKAEKKITISKG